MKKIALITGASKGIGKGLAQKLLAEGYQVKGTSRDGQIDIHQPDFEAWALDLSKENSIQQLLSHIKKENINIDLLINNAGVGPDLGNSLPDRATFEQTINVNLTGLVFFYRRTLSATQY